MAEYGATLIGMEIIRAKTAKSSWPLRQKAAVSIASIRFPYSELEAVETYSRNYMKTGVQLVMCKIADKVGLHALTVNALRKFKRRQLKCALGMKGPIFVLYNDYLLDELWRRSKHFIRDKDDIRRVGRAI